MAKNDDTIITIRQLLFPISLMSFILLILLSFQTAQILRDRDALHEAKGQQEQPFAEAQKLQTQLTALVLGTQKLADQGNKNAQPIVNKLKEMGVLAGSNQTTGADNPPVPADEKSAKSAKGGKDDE